MFVSQISSITLIVACIALVRAEYSESDMKDAKMVFCGECKDATVKADLDKYGKCMSGLFPEEMKKLKDIKDSNKADHDACITKVLQELQTLAKDHKDKQEKIVACFHDNVEHKHLSKCH